VQQLRGEAKMGTNRMLEVALVERWTKHFEIERDSIVLV
jgi:hypothetical protein